MSGLPGRESDLISPLCWGQASRGTPSIWEQGREEGSQTGAAAGRPTTELAASQALNRAVLSSSAVWFCFTHFCTFLCHSLSTLPGQQVDRPWSSGLGKAWNHGCSQRLSHKLLHRSPAVAAAAASGSAQDWLLLSKPRGNLSKSQDDATAWGLLDFVLTLHPYGHGLSGLRPPGSFEGSGTNGLSLRTALPDPRLHSATTCLHLTPTIQRHVAQHPRPTEPLEQTNFRGRQFTLTSFTC